MLGGQIFQDEVGRLDLLGKKRRFLLTNLKYTLIQTRYHLASRPWVRVRYRRGGGTLPLLVEHQDAVIPNYGFISLAIGAGWNWVTPQHQLGELLTFVSESGGFGWNMVGYNNYQSY